MCFYDQYVYTCSDFKWGNFREHCNKEYRMGETCGMKLVYQVAKQPSKCKLCERVDTKLRKRQQECDRITRWRSEGRNPASIDKSYETIAVLDSEISQIYGELGRKRQSIGGNQARQQPQSYVPQQAYAQTTYTYGYP
jgi:hypothetical protein